MRDIYHTSLVCACLVYNIALSLATRTVQVSFETGSGIYNVKEDITLKCDVTSETPIFLGFELSWYKNQDGEWVDVSQQRQLKEPFAAKPDKYILEIVNDEETYMTSQLSLTIRGLETEDTGDYMCKAGYPKKDDMTDSNEVKMLTNPASDESTQISLTPSASDDGSRISFNVGKEIKCNGQADSLSNNLNLIIKLASGPEITQDFVHTKETVWTGEAGMKKPTTRIQLIKDEWLPEKPGQEDISCYLQDGDRQLAVQTFGIIRDETAGLECMSNYKRPVREDDLDVIITCNVVNYIGEMDGVELEWSFLQDEEKVTVTAPQQKFQRIAKRKGDDFNLLIPRVSSDMVAYGKAFEYGAKLRHKTDGSDIASATYALAIDSTRKYTNSASCTHLALGLILISSVLQKVL